MVLTVSIIGKMATQSELSLASEIMKTVRRLQLPLKLDEITEGRGNCFPLSILAQGRRSEIFRALSSLTQIMMLQNDPNKLRREVFKFMTNSRHRTIQNYKKKYEEVLASVDDMPWEKYWEVMLRNYEWVDYIFIQSTAWYLHHDIIIVTTTSTETHPYITISGNLVDEKIPCPGIAITIGSKSNVHYQSLLPIEIRIKRNQIKPNLPENTIELELENPSRGNSQPDLDLESKSQFPDLIPSPIKHPTDSRQPPTAGFRRSSMGAKVGATLGATPSTTGKTNSSRPSAQNQDEIIAGPSSDTESRVFKYELRGKILNFEFTSEKRIKCASCGTQFKNILRHLQQSKCGLSNTDDLIEKFKEFTKHDANKRKADQNKRKAK